MARQNYHQSAFKNGMISKKLYGRTDIDEYAYSAKEMYNMLPAPMGGTFSRPGTVTQVYQDEDCAVIPWERSDDNYFIVFKQKAYNISDFCFTVYDSNWVALSNTEGFHSNLTTGQLLNRDGTTTGLPTHKSLIEFQTNTGVNFETLSLDGFSYTTYNNVLILTHSSGTIPPLVFSVTAPGFLRIEHFQFSGDLSTEGMSNLGSYFSSVDMAFGFLSSPYLINKSTTHLLPSVTIGVAGAFTSTYVTGTLTSYEGNTATVKDFFTADMKWTFVVLNQGDKEGVYFITSIASTSVANVTCIAYGLDTTTKSRNFRRQLFMPSLGFPKLVGAFNNRISFANTAEKPSWFFASRTNNYREILGFTLFQLLATFPITEVDSFEFPLTSRDFSEVRWIAHQNDVIMGTSSGEYSVTSGESVLSALNISINPESSIGGSFVPAIKNSESIFFVSSDGKSIRKVQYNFDVRGYRSQNISILNDDIIYKIRGNQTVDSQAGIKIVKLAWQESNRCLWVLTNTDNLFSVTIEPNSQTMAWAYHEIGVGHAVKDIFTFQSKSLDRSFLGLVVQRDSSYFIEFMAPEYLNDSLEVDSINIGDQPVFVDGALITSLLSSATVLTVSIPNFSSGILIPTVADDFLGLSQRLVTGKRFTMSGVSPSTGTLFNGASVYLIVKNTGYGYPLIYIATSLANALAGISFTPAAVTAAVLTDAEPTATYTKWGSYIYLAGKTVDVIADGILREGLVVDANGILTLPVAASKVVVGYFFGGKLETITPEVSTKEGSSHGSLLRAREAYVRYYKSRTGSIGSSESNLEPIVFPEVPFTGALRTTIDTTTDREYSIILKKEKSLPLNVMSITFRGEV